MSKSPWFKVLIRPNPNPDYWYADKVGDVIIVKKTEWDEGFYEHKSGLSVFKGDVTPIAYYTPGTLSMQPMDCRR